VKTWLRWFAVLPAAVLAPAVIGTAVDIAIGFEDLSPIAAGLRAWIGPHDFGQLVQSFLAPLTFIWVGAQVAPSRRRTVGLVLAALYLAFTGWQIAQLAQAGVTREAIGESGRAVLLAAEETLSLLGFALGIYLTVFRKPAPAAAA
jgi:hypothetical protein